MKKLTPEEVNKIKEYFDFVSYKIPGGVEENIDKMFDHIAALESENAELRNIVRFLESANDSNDGNGVWYIGKERWYGPTFEDAVRKAMNAAKGGE